MAQQRKMPEPPDGPVVSISIKALAALIGMVIGGGGATYLSQQGRDVEARVERVERQVIRLEQSIDTKLELLDKRILSVLSNQQIDRDDRRNQRR